MRRLVRTASIRRFLPVLLLSAGLTLYQPFQQALAYAAKQKAVSSADPTVRIWLARSFSGSSKLYLSRNTGTYQAVITGSDSSLPAVCIEPGQLVEFQYSAAADSKPITRKDASHLVCRLTAGQSISLTPDDAGSFSDPSSDPTPGSFGLQLDSHSSVQHYRGAIQVTALTSGMLRVVNSVALEDYLKGVIGPEIGESAPLEALKAQAIAARTYTIKNLGKLAFAGADLDDTNRCQNYLGVDAENWRCRTAVEQTAGEVLTYEGSLIDAVYATDCGGMTAQGDEPYLKPVADPDCAGATPWTMTVSATALQAALAKSGVIGVANIDYVAVHDRDSSGRAATLTCTDEATSETEDVSATLVRKALGYDLLRSTLFRVSMSPDTPDLVSSSAKPKAQPHGSCATPLTGNVTFTGKGWGHGLGMCQHGAVQMARLNSATDEQILHHFYSGVVIVSLTAALIDSSASTSPPAVQSAWSAAGLAAYAANSRKNLVFRSRSATLLSTTGKDDIDAPTTAKAKIAAPSPRRGF